MNAKKTIAMIGFLLMTLPVQSYIQRVNSECQFYRTINKRSIAIVMFYQENKDTRKDPCVRSHLCSTLSYLERMSRIAWYNDGDCIFVIVNVNMQELCSLMHRFGINHLPSFMLFYNSSPVRDPAGQLALLTGYVLRDILESFIDRHVGGTIEDNVQERAEQRRIAREQAQLRYEYYAPYFYWGYPYWGGCGCPGFGFGFGFGNCY